MKRCITLSRIAGGCILLSVLALGCSDLAVGPTSDIEDSRPLRLAKAGGSSNYWYKEKTFKADRDGSMQSNKTRLEVPAGALEEDTRLWMKIIQETPCDLPDALNRTYEFGPDAVEFLQPLILELYYGDADLGDEVEGTLQLYYYSVSKGTWEWVGGTVDVVGKKVVFTGFLDHFSRYALAPSR